MNPTVIVIAVIAITAIIAASAALWARRTRRLDRERKARDEATRERLKREGRAAEWLSRQLPYI